MKRSRRPIPVARTLSDAQFTAKTPWDSARHDAFTFGLALHYLKTAPAARALHRLRRDRRLGAREALRPRPRFARPHGCAAEDALDVAAERPGVPRQHRPADHGRSWPRPHHRRLVVARRQVVRAEETWLAAVGPGLAEARRMAACAARLHEPDCRDAGQGARPGLSHGGAGRGRTDRLPVGEVTGRGSTGFQGLRVAGSAGSQRLRAVAGSCAHGERRVHRRSRAHDVAEDLRLRCSGRPAPRRSIRLTACWRASLASLARAAARRRATRRHRRLPDVRVRAGLRNPDPATLQP